MALTSIAVVPTLGSSLLSEDEFTSQTTPELLPTGCEEIDDALGGGLCYSDIVTIASATQASQSMITLHFIASHLLRRTSDVVVIDTTGAFAVDVLRDVIADKLLARRKDVPLQHAGYVYQQSKPQASEPDSELIDQATTMLDRVRLARIFDVTGLVEIVGELRQLCGAANIDAVEKVGTGPIAASVGLVVVDEMSSLINPLMSNSYAESQALLASILRSLRHLTNNHHVCAILLNGVTGGKVTGNNASTNHHPSEATSIFGSVTVKPALGQTFASLIDMSMMLGRVPKMRKDAEAIYGAGSSGQRANAAYIETLEVLKDRSGSRQDRIAAFELAGGRNLVGYSG